MLPTALVPVRISRTAKRRLAHVLGPDDRMRLVRALFEHVVCVVREAGLHVVALSPNDVLDVEGIEVWRDEAPGLNGAIGAAITRIGMPVFVIHADLPKLTAADVDDVLRIPGHVVIARARDGGTNGLLLRRPIALAFGPSSSVAHAANARAAGLSARVVDLPGFALDVDDESGLSASGAVSVLDTRP